MQKKTRNTLRLKVIRPVYTTQTVAEEARAWFHPEEPLSTSAQVADLFAHLRRESKEVFATVHLDTKNRVLCVETVSVGSLSAAIVHPREVYKSALLSSAAALVLVHNHPSGDPTPSREDLELTARLREGGELLGVRVLDHVIVGGEGSYVSFADRGLL
jgi:DNA repair protein RadC